MSAPEAPSDYRASCIQFFNAVWLAYNMDQAYDTFRANGLPSPTALDLAIDGLPAATN